MVASEQAPGGTATANGDPADNAGDGPVRFGTFTGVFTPTLLTIFGVIMYVRIGWAVGNAGLLGAWLVMLLSVTITAATSLSLSSIATNTRVGPGGPYAIITRSLGLEVGGSIGLSLYLTRPLGVAMYIIGFREGWLWVFPDHPAIAVDLSVFALLVGISYVSANLAFRVQFLIMAVIFGSLASIFLSPVTFEPRAEITWWGDYPGSPETGFEGINFWIVFAVFFPAGTGILAGANMSGDLKNPRRAIPVGTLWALGLSSVIYFALAWWCARAGTPEELTSNYTIAIDRALWPPLVLAGLLGATASSALAGLVGGPRILMAMGQNRIIPGSAVLARTGRDGNPRVAILVTAAITAAFLMVRDLNAIAILVTMFFLITYAMLNVVVLVEGKLGLVSFRPTLRIPLLVPLIGVVGAMFSMFIVNPTFGLVAVGMVVATYWWIRRRGRAAPTEDVRSSVFVAMAQWAASRVTNTEHENKRAWKPNLLVPVRSPERVRGRFQLLIDLTRPDGSITLLGLSQDADREPMRRRLVDLSEAFRREHIHSSATVLRAGDAPATILSSLEALQAAFFRPNVLLLNLASSEAEDIVADLPGFVEAASRLRVGMVVVAMHPAAGLGHRRRVNLWVRPAPGTWDPVAAFSSGNLNLNLLTAYRLLRQWDAEVTMLTVIGDEADEAAARGFQEELCDLARFPASVEREVVVGGFERCLEQAPDADINIVGLPANRDSAYLRQLVTISRSTCIFVCDSGRESALV
jgi:solute carrier family 12 (sodium/potassium/chloride transporter), member 2